MDAPPSYAEAVYGIQRTEPVNGWPLAHVDIWPRCHNGEQKIKHGQFDQFQAVMGLANDWLGANPSCELISCETVKKKSYYTEEIYNGSVYFSSSAESAVWVHGLRMWLRTSSRGDPITLEYMDLQPQPDEPGVKYPNFETINNLVDRFNAMMISNPLGGKIISIDTVCVSASEDMKTGTNPLQTVYMDTYKKHRYYFLRIFYCAGSYTGDCIGLADFTPVQLEDTGVFKAKPKFEGHQILMQKAQNWIASNGGIRVTNIQTVDSRYWKLGEHGQRLDTLCTADYKTEERFRILYIRVAYTRPNDPSDVPPERLRTMCVPFVPQQISQAECCGSEATYETVPAMITRAGNWAKRTGAQVLSVETCCIPESLFWENLNQVNSTEISGEWYVVRSNNNTNYYRHKLLMFIRVYLEQPVREVPGQQFPTSTECAIL